jgi:hypothetical protein
MNEVKNRPTGRKFWTASDAAGWIDATVSDRKTWVGSPTDLAIWWRCYQYAEQLIDDTTKHVAESLLGGIPEFTEQTVTDDLQEWPDESGEIGATANSSEVDASIERDLETFFHVEKPTLVPVTIEEFLES